MRPYAISFDGEFSEQRRSALLTLLADDDPDIVEQVRDTIIASGPKAIQWLRPHALSDDPLLRRRVITILQQFEQHAADNEFVVFCLNAGQNLDLERGMLLLSRTAYPEVNPEGYTALLDTFANDLGERIADARTPSQKLGVVRSYLFDHLGFAGNRDNYFDPQNSYLNRVLDRRKGIPITLCALYILLGKRLQLPITGIGMPGHFLCRYQTSAVEIYIDAFRGGRLMTKIDCIKYLVRGKQPFNDSYLAPVNPRQILTRMCRNLQQIYQSTQDLDAATRLRRYIVALSG